MIKLGPLFAGMNLKKWSEGNLLQGFGINAYAYPGYKGHPGIDLYAPKGTPIWAAYDAKVIFAGWNGRPGGYEVWLETADIEGRKYQLKYAHVQNVKVKEGTLVKMGQVICEMGNSGQDGAGQEFPVSNWGNINPGGNKTHCHFSVLSYKFDGLNYNPEFLDNGYQGNIDPLPYFSEIPFIPKPDPQPTPSAPQGPTITLMSQRDSRWRSMKLGTSKTLTIGSHGCALTCIGMLTGLTPDYLNKKVAFLGEDLINWSKTATILGMEWTGSKNTPDFYPVIAETTLDGHQHFVVVDKDGLQYDPWTGTTTRKYKLKSYRNIRIKGVTMDFRAQANDVLNKFTGRDNNSPDTEALAEAWAKGDAAKSKEIINRYRTQYPLGSGGTVDALIQDIQSVINKYKK